MDDNRTNPKPAPVPDAPYQSISVWYDPALDSGPRMDAVQTVEVDCDDCLQPPEACAECVDGLMFVRREDDVDYDPDDLWMDPDEGDYPVLDMLAGCEWYFSPRWVPRKMMKIANNYDANFWTGEGKRFIRAHRKVLKRRSAMRRQGKR